jgi:hypothetical protein
MVNATYRKEINVGLKDELTRMRIGASTSTTVWSFNNHLQTAAAQLWLRIVRLPSAAGAVAQGACYHG